MRGKRNKNDTHKNCEGVNRIRAERTWQKWVGMNALDFFYCFFSSLFFLTRRIVHTKATTTASKKGPKAEERRREKGPSKCMLSDGSFKSEDGKYFNFKLQATYEIHTAQHKYSRSQQTDYYYICVQHFDELWNYIAVRNSVTLTIHMPMTNRIDSFVWGRCFWARLAPCRIVSCVYVASKIKTKRNKTKRKRNENDIYISVCVGRIEM